MNRVLGVALPAALLAGAALILVAEAREDGLTYDEGKYIRAGACAVAGGRIDLEPTNPAGFKLLAGLGVAAVGPRTSSACSPGDYQPFFALPPDAVRALIFAARLPFVGLTLCLGFGVFLWTRALFGYVAAVASLAITCFEPNLLGHGHLATGDLALSLGILVCLGGFWQFGETGRSRWLLASGFGLGFALLAKVIALYLLPVLVLVALLRRRPSPRSVLGVAASAWVLVCLVYLPFDGPTSLSWLAPPSWFEGVGFQFHHTTGGTLGYLNGATSNGRGFITYFAEAFLLKSSVGFIALTLGAGWLTIVRRDARLACFVWLPVVGLFLITTAGGIDIGVRYILPIFPLLAIAIAGLVDAVPGRRQLALWALTAIAIASSLLRTPYHLGYFNELAGSTPERYLADSNIDWGQDAWRLRDWWQSNGSPPITADYFGALPLTNYGIPAREFAADATENVAIAISIQKEVVFGDRPPARARFLERIGTSIDVYELAP